jgi:hypothetical protein
MYQIDTKCHSTGHNVTLKGPEEVDEEAIRTQKSQSELTAKHIALGSCGTSVTSHCGSPNAKIQASWVSHDHTNEIYGDEGKNAETKGFLTD